MQNDLVFRCIVMTLFIGARYVRWHARHDISWQASWPTMKKHPRDTVVLISLSLCWLSATVIYLVRPQWVSDFALAIPSWVRWSAVATALASLALLWWSDRCLGKNLSVTLKIREGHTLVSHGPYSRVRHPVYSATLIYSAALATITANYLLGALFVIPMATLVLQRMGREEQLMVEQFGDEYRDYMQRTGRLVPRLLGRFRNSKPSLMI